MNVLELAGWKDRRRWASTHGGEWQGPCPSCGGSKRFHVWPYQREGGSYWCRDCGKTGDNIQYLIDFKGMKFKEACEFLRITVPERPADWRPAPPRAKPEYVPRAPELPADLWQERAGKLIAWAQGELEKNAEVLAWLAGRGISGQTARDYSLGWNPGEDGKDIYRSRAAWGLPESRRDDGRLRALWIPVGLVIPCSVDGIIQRIRIRPASGDPRYYVLAGSSPHTMILGRDRRAFVVVEAELDAIAVMANNRLSGAVGLGSVSARPTAEAFEVLKKALQILVAVDYDQAGAKEMAWWKEHFARCDRWPVPLGKDPGEAFAMGTDLEKWIRAGLPPALTIEEKDRGTRIEERGSKKDEPAPFALESQNEKAEKSQAPPLLLELRDLLRKNPAVRIINTPGRFTVLRDGRYVGGRINHLVFREPQVRDYLLGHTAGEIGWENLMQQWRAGHED